MFLAKASQLISGEVLLVECLSRCHAYLRVELLICQGDHLVELLFDVNVVTFLLGNSKDSLCLAHKEVKPPVEVLCCANLVRDVMVTEGFVDALTHLLDTHMVRASWLAVAENSVEDVVLSFLYDLLLKDLYSEERAEVVHDENDLKISRHDLSCSSHVYHLYAQVLTG